MLADIQFRGNDGRWGIISRSSFPLLISWIKGEVKGFKVDALAADTILVAEAAILNQEGFSLIPEEIILGIGPHRRTMKIFRIEKS
ncbi:MAG: hypothetical protein COW72_00265 [Candidatus Nealsonbacteria bacterium CG18_big_fil_WC_8_21_14_2_50_37_10]|uniref:Uncharacterized protein n=1 Tax=Candidatus Nealsonbacteria bacterium CG18_big_fil_WC_8_21_14_2_50_37_10 TaxID=1974717 RepID=A0A2H0FL71_9BACT|nr:MAG: hypothetical protein COW72_00265 [Candidatus Nealsonbacteria bacterium CG18_big_fil_WC_8_21_14_2_50_37_10]